MVVIGRRAEPQEAPAVLSLFQSSRSLFAVCSLVVVSMFAADSVTIRSGDTLSELALEHDVSVADLLEWNDIDDPDSIEAGARLLVSPPDAPPERYVVQSGDTLTAVAARFGTSISKVVGTNGIADPDVIIAGQTLDLTGEGSPPSAASPATTMSYTVAPGDTLSEIAEAHGLRTSALADANDISDRDLVRVGRTLVIPAGDTPATPAPETPSPTAAPAPAAPTTAAPSPDAVPPPTTAAPAPAAPAATGSSGVGPVLTPLFSRWAGIYGLDQGLLEALASQESDWRPDAVGPGGHLGIAQLSPDTVAFVEERLLGLEMNPLDASDGIQMAGRYLRYLVDRTSSEREALAAWNQGLASVQNGGISASGAAFADAVLQIRQLRS